MLNSANYPEIPPAILTGLVRYADDHCPPGGFLRAVLSNDLLGAMGRADEGSRAALFGICKFVHNEMPGVCHGSPKTYADWIKRGEKLC